MGFENNFLEHAAEKCPLMDMLIISGQDCPRPNSFLLNGGLFLFVPIG
jgi:hypothetical protein